MRAATGCGPVHMTGGLLLVLVLPVVSLQIIVAGNYGNGSVHTRQVAYQTLLRLWLGERPRPKPHRPVIHTGLSWLAWLAG